MADNSGGKAGADENANVLSKKPRCSSNGNLRMIQASCEMDKCRRLDDTHPHTRQGYEQGLEPIGITAPAEKNEKEPNQASQIPENCQVFVFLEFGDELATYYRSHGVSDDDRDYSGAGR